MSDTVWDRLRSPFPPDDIQWRVGSTTKDKKRGMALAYIDARAVMDRLDAVLGPANWQDEYYEVSGRILCRLSVKDPATSCWVQKSDGSGDTDFEAEKGGISSAFKRAAVRFGIGRYLYHLKNTWVELDERGNIRKLPTLPPWALPQRQPQVRSKPKPEPEAEPEPKPEPEPQAAAAPPPQKEPDGEPQKGESQNEGDMWWRWLRAARNQRARLGDRAYYAILNAVGMKKADDVPVQDRQKPETHEKLNDIMRAWMDLPDLMSDEGFDSEMESFALDFQDLGQYHVFKALLQDAGFREPYTWKSVPRDIRKGMVAKLTRGLELARENTPEGLKDGIVTGEKAPPTNGEKLPAHEQR